MQDQDYIGLVLTNVEIEIQEKIFENNDFKHSSISFELKTIDGNDVDYDFLSITDEYIPKVFEIDELYTLEDYINFKYVIKEGNKYYFASSELLPLKTFTREIKFKIEKDKNDFLLLKKFINSIKTYKGFKDFYLNHGHITNFSINSEYFGPAKFVEIIQKLLFTNHKNIEDEIDSFCTDFFDLEKLCNKLKFIKSIISRPVSIPNKNLNLIYIPIGTYFSLCKKFLTNYNSKVYIAREYNDLYINEKDIKFLQIVTHGNNKGLDHDYSVMTNNISLSDFLNTLNFNKIDHLGLSYCQSFPSETSLSNELKKVNIKIAHITYTKMVYYESLALLFSHGVIKAQDYTNAEYEINEMGKIATFTYSTALKTGVDFYSNNIV